MLNDTLELNMAAKLHNKCQTDVNNHSNKCSGPNLKGPIHLAFCLQDLLAHASM
jgi:hypothetical protein